MARVSNYEITKQRVQKGFCKENHAKIAEKLNIPMDEGYLFLRFFDRDYRIHRESGVVEWKAEDTWVEGEFNEVLTIYDLLCYSREDAYPKNEFILAHQLANMYNASSYAGEGMFGKYEKIFTGKIEKLAEVCESVGGKPEGKGDISYRIPLFKGMDFRLAFWEADEDFPPQLQLFFDKNALMYMHYETVWYVMGHVLDRIVEIGF